MGRRPNAIVTEFFSRGAKLEDSSNRYQHTCRRCGELFPKGRAEGLVNHLVKNCPNVTLDDRKIIAQHVEQTSKKQNVSTGVTAFHNAQHSTQNGALSLTLERQQSALETLAEVSRRHMDYSSLRGAQYDQSQLLQDTDQSLAEQALWAQLHQHNLGLTNGQSQNDTYNFDGDTSMHQVLSTADYNTPLLSTSLPQQSHLDPQLGAGQDQSFHMAHAADGLLPNSVQDNNTQVHDPVDWATELANNFPQEILDTAARLRHKNTQTLQLNEVLETAAQLQAAQQTALEEAPQAANDTFDSSVSQPVPQQIVFNASQTVGGRPRARGRFTESRRKQVQELRKQGACLRCRMLKKPCSEGTPCNTCANIDSAKLWKAKCSRSRIAEEFTAWSVGYFQAEAQLKQQTWTADSSMLRQISVRFDFDAESGITLSARSGGKAMLTSSAITLLRDGLLDCLRIEEGDDLPDKLATYCMSDSVLRAAIANEPHTFVRTTLIESVDLLAKERAQAEEHSKTETRSCYTVPNSLTRDTLELWMLTACLTAEHASLASFSPHFFVHDSTGVAGDELVRAQLLAAVESRAARLSKKVFNDLERRLLQRQQVSGFATYIAALVLLSCVERMSALYQHYAERDASTWPLNIDPSSIWNQGPAFTALLAMLLRMRGLPPQTFTNDDGKLAVVYETSDKLLKINGSASEEQLRATDEERRSALTSWLAKCNIDAAEVRSWTEDTSTDWYGRLMAALLQ